MPPISAVPGLPALGWDDGWAAALEALGDPSVFPARVSRVDRGICTVMTGAAEIRVATERAVEVAVGDWVGMASPLPSAGGARARIAAILPRRMVLRRQADARGAPLQVLAANVDTVMLCDALGGNLSLRHLERFLALAWQSGATPVVVITKCDNVAPAMAAEVLEVITAVADEARVLVVSSTSGEGIAELAPWLVPGRTVALLGLSGAGKSTLVNVLAGAQVLATRAVRSDGSGRHTTTHRQLVVLPGGGIVIDTPGMRALSVSAAREGVEHAFGDVAIMARDCRYADCSHSGEPGCALQAALRNGHLARDRMESWLKLRAVSPSSALETARRQVSERKQRKAAKIADRRAARTWTGRSSAS